jgi:hypothetical protein
MPCRGGVAEQALRARQWCGSGSAGRARSSRPAAGALHLSLGDQPLGPRQLVTMLGRNSTVVRKPSQVRQALEAGTSAAKGGRSSHWAASAWPWRGSPRPKLRRNIGEPVVSSGISSPRMLMRCWKRSHSRRRLVLDRRVAGRHLRRGVVEHPLHRVQRDLVLHPRADGVAELVRGHSHRTAGGVAGVAVGQPPAQAVVERAPQERQLAVGVLADTRQQDRRRRSEPLAQILLLAAVCATSRSETGMTASLESWWLEPAAPGPT